MAILGVERILSSRCTGTVSSSPTFLDVTVASFSAIFTKRPENGNIITVFAILNPV